MGKTTFSWWRQRVDVVSRVDPGSPPPDRDGTLGPERQSRFHRLVGTTSGYVEGWALYAERLMDEWATSRTRATNSATSPTRRCARRASSSTSASICELDAPSDIGVLGHARRRLEQAVDAPRWPWRSSRSGRSRTTPCRSRRSTVISGFRRRQSPTRSASECGSPRAKRQKPASVTGSP